MQSFLPASFTGAVQKSSPTALLRGSTPSDFFSFPSSKSDFKSSFNIASLGSTHQITIRFYPVWGMALSTLWSLLNTTVAPFNNQVLKQNSHYFIVPSIE